MSAPVSEARKGLSDYFSVAQGRVDRWRTVHRLARALAAGGKDEGLRAKAADEIAAVEPLEELCAYPGPALMARVKERLQTGEYAAFARLAQRISISLLSNSYRDDIEAWKSDDEGDAHTPDVLPPGIGRGQSRKPYFEVLVVSPGDRSTWHETRESLRHLRRDTDSFVYEPVVVGSFEDAVLAAIVNYNIQSVVIYDGFPYPSQHDVQDLRDILGPHLPARKDTVDGDLGTLLAQVLRAYRPELDIFLATDRDVGALAGSDETACVRRVFYGLEEMLEIHLSILDGILDRYTTPYFDNLKKYAQRPIGTFHALPIARGKSIFKSNWIRDMGEFYGTNLFLAESSATTGGLDSLLEPTGNIKVAQDKAARAFGGDRCVLRDQRHVDLEQDRAHGAHAPGRHRADRPRLPQVAPLRLRARRRPAATTSTRFRSPSTRCTAASRSARSRRRCCTSRPRASSTARRMLVLTNCTFDGHVANVQQTMLECLAIKPDLIFLWDEAWFGFARFSPFLRRRTAMGATARIREMLADPAYKERYKAFRAKVGEIDPKNKALLDTPLLPDPDKVRAARLRDRFGAQVDVVAAPGLDRRGLPTRTSTRSSRCSRRPCSRTPRRRPTCRSSRRSTSRAGRWSWKATSSCSAPPSSRSSCAATSTRTR